MGPGALIFTDHKSRWFVSMGRAAQSFNGDYLMIYTRISNAGNMLNAFEATLPVRRWNPPGF